VMVDAIAALEALCRRFPGFGRESGRAQKTNCAMSVTLTP